MKKLMLGAAALALMTAPALAQLKFTPGEDAKFSWDSYEAFKGKHDLAGKTLTIAGPWTGPDQELVESVIAYFEEATGADVTYTGSDSFEQQIVIDAQAGSPPNIGVFPQPGLAADMASRGFLSPLPDGSAEFMKENYAAGQSWVDLGTYKGKDGEEAFYAFPYKADVKSLVWYVPANFEDAGYEVPQSYEELKELTEKIKEDGETPWCIGLASGGATGWPATDWVEDLMLRTATPDVYDKWVTNEIPFDAPEVVNAIKEYGYFVREDGSADGGAKGAAATDFRESPKGLFATPPKCYMHHQASFIPTFFPEGTEIGRDADFFYFPASAEREGELGKPVLGAGTLFGITKPNDVTDVFIEFLQTPIAHEVWMAQSGFLTPYTKAKPEAYATDAMRKQGEILTNATTFRFDGSDLMPGKIGAGAFWTGMIDYTTGAKEAEAVAGEIQNEWQSIK